jgi:predicted nuclease of predicted toxin-antitoxin system
MALTFYMDQHIPKEITVGLRLRGVDVTTAYDDGAAELTDPELLDRASALQRVLFTQDDDLLSEAVRRQRANISFSGVIYAHQLQVSIGVCVKDLELIAQVGDPKDMVNQIQFLPL